MRTEKTLVGFSKKSNSQENYRPVVASIPIPPQITTPTVMMKYNQCHTLPEIKIRTSRNNGQVTIEVSDSGYSIPAHIRDKIFQPFFTTKTTGQATGPGLCLCYDTIKAHRGEIYVDNQVSNGASFLVKFPVS